ncbi:Mannosyl-oligosaccharide glucosidase [Rhynchospora pubera]|uniref:Mannosyl-oligosaccharide glucosidase n=1 Tax=Rhynchospora pubera TaxID=906938 RepID=A0AAV8BZ72_9POAL|nr:Mannosyl-oligosaccharide glucosidase [Rhynchospora pubera]
MAGGNRTTTHRSRGRGSPESTDADADADATRGKSRRQGARRPHLQRRISWTFPVLGFVTLLLIGSLVYYQWGFGEGEGELVKRAKRSVTPLPMPKLMDLPQFGGYHKDSLYWGTYRPHVYLGIRARTPQSLIFGMMWLGIKNGQYHLRHVCQDSDELSTYGWVEHNGRDYGRQVLRDHDFYIETSFLKQKGEESGFGGDWAVRLDISNEVSNNAEESPMHLFFYIADESGQSFTMNSQESYRHGTTLLASGSRADVGAWQLQLHSLDSVEVHTAGYKSPHMHNLTELVQATLAVNARRTGLIQLPDIKESYSNIMVYQISAELPAKVDLVFLSGVDSESSTISERVATLTGNEFTRMLSERQKAFGEKYDRLFDTKQKVNKEEKAVGKAAIGNLLGGIGYFYGQSKIAIPKDLTLKNGEKSISYWPAELYTAVPSRSFFPRGFLWDEGFHQFLVWRWDVDICMDIIGHWLDLLNVDGWIPREQILGAEALSKVPEEFVVQYPSNGNPPTLFLSLRDLSKALYSKEFSSEEAERISTFLERAYPRLDAWFQWFNTTQSGKHEGTFYWHGRDNSTRRELNPKTLTSGLDDFPRASHPNDEERHVDLRCWMLLASNCMHSIQQMLGIKHTSVKDYALMTKKLSEFDVLNKLHLDEKSGAYFDFGYHTEKVRLRWHELRENEVIRREFLRETLEQPRLRFVPHIGYVSLFPFMMGIIPPESWVLGKQLDLISNRSILWTDYGLRSLSKISTVYMKHNTEHDPPYWRGAIWINMNYMILSSLHHYLQVDGPYKDRAGELYEELRSNLIRNIVKNYHETGFLWENYDQKNKGKGKGARPFTGWSSLVVLIMAESYPNLAR